MKQISVEDFNAPVFSQRAKQILAEREKIPVEFSLSGILAYAKTLCDVPLFRDPAMEDSFERFLTEGDKKGGLSESGRKLLAAEIASLIVQRSRLENLIELNPEILDIEIKEPIIIAGIPRSGTTNLSNILASDSRLRSLQWWEYKTPFPPKGGNPLESLSKADLIKIGQQAMADMREILPLSHFMYDLSFEDAMEELCFMAIAGCPSMYMTQAYTPDWNHWFYNQMDPTEMYQVIKKSFQAMNWRTGNSKRWVLKTPHHLGFLPALTKVFPGSHVIITHRDPASSTVSNATMNAYASRETHDNPDPKHGYHVAIDMADGMIGGLVRDFDNLCAASITEVHFHEYMADVMGTVERIYANVGMPFTDQARQELQGYIDAHPRGRHGGRLVYNPERDFGITREEIRERYLPYIDKFSIKIEQSHA